MPDKVKLTKRQQAALDIAASIQSMAEMRIPGDAKDAIARLALIEIDAVRIQKLLSVTTKEALSAVKAPPVGLGKMGGET